MSSQKLRNGAVAAFALVAIATTSLAAQAQGDQATLKVDNRNTLDVVVYAVTDNGDRYRVGSVNRLSTADLTLPAELTDGITQFRIKVYSFEHGPYISVAKARDAIKTQPMVTSPGQTLQFLVEARMTESHIIGP